MKKSLLLVKSISAVAAYVQEKAGATILINERLTPPEAETHRRNLKCINCKTNVAVRWSRLCHGLDDVRTVQELKLLLARCIVLRGGCLDARRFLVVDASNRTMHGLCRLPKLGA